MSDRCSQQLEVDDLDDVVFGTTASSTQLARITRHAATCPPCKHELAWLRAERRLFSERAQREPLAAPEFRDFVRYRGIREAVPAPPEETGSAKRKWWPMASGLAAAAAILLLFVNGHEAIFPIDGAAAGGQSYAATTANAHHLAAPAEMTFARQDFTPASFSSSLDEVCESPQHATSGASFAGASWSEARDVSEQATSVAGFTSDDEASCVAHPSGAICDSGS